MTCIAKKAWCLLVSQLRSNKIEFIEDGHIYLLNGIQTPSVSELLRKKFPDKYANVPSYVLQNKAEYGGKVHAMIERFESGRELGKLGIFEKISLTQYQKLKQAKGFTVESQEHIIWYKDKFCGRYDMTTINKNGFLCLGDIKTTYKLDREYLSYQLSLYELAYEWTYEVEPFPFAEMFCLWIPKGELGEYVPIERIDRETLLKEFDLYE